MKTTNILGISPTVNCSACLFKDGILIAMAEEERFNRIKTGGGALPMNAVKYCLSEGDISLGDVDYIAISWDCGKYPEFMKKFNSDNLHLPGSSKIDKLIEKTYIAYYDPDYFRFKILTDLQMMGMRDKPPEIRFIPHHISHAASSFYMSGFGSSTILTIDGSGEENATILWKGVGKEITEIKRFNLPHSLGWFYSAITEFLGFKARTGEGKVMGLAPYGKENPKIREKLGKIIKISKEGYEIDPSFIYFDKRTRSKRFTDKLVELFGEPCYPKQASTQFHKDLAYEVQYLLEKAVENLVLYAIKETKINKVCMAGGVAMNCKMNGKIGELDEVEDIFVNPASADNGCSLGAALQMYKELGEDPKKNTLSKAYYGPGFSNEEIKKVLDLCMIKYKYYEDIEKIVAEKIAKEKIVGWFQGRMEFGARALGNRSILANPINKNMKDILNAKVKHRESFRPFCPSLLYEDMDKYMVNAKNSPFMIRAFQAVTGIKERLPSIVHVDNSIRTQTVRKEDNERYWKLINEFKKITGESVILNTSFNIAGEPIICTPEEAIRCFYGTGIDCLAIGNYFIEKNK